MVTVVVLLLLLVLVCYGRWWIYISTIGKTVLIASGQRGHGLLLTPEIGLQWKTEIAQTWMGRIR